MTSSPLLQQFESGDSSPLQSSSLPHSRRRGSSARLTAILELPWPQQILSSASSPSLSSSGSTAAQAPTWSRSHFCSSPSSPPSATDTGDSTPPPDSSSHPASRASLVDAVFILLLLFAETYAFITLFLGYLQTLWPLRRTPVALPDDPNAGPPSISSSRPSTSLSAS